MYRRLSHSLHVSETLPSRPRHSDPFSSLPFPFLLGLAVSAVRRTRRVIEVRAGAWVWSVWVFTLLSWVFLPLFFFLRSSSLLTEVVIMLFFVYLGKRKI